MSTYFSQWVKQNQEKHSKSLIPREQSMHSDINYKCKEETFSTVLTCDDDDSQQDANYLSPCESNRKIIYLSVHNTDPFLHHSHVLDLLWGPASPLLHQDAPHHQPHVVHAERIKDHNTHMSISKGCTNFYLCSKIHA